MWKKRSIYFVLIIAVLCGAVGIYFVMNYVNNVIAGSAYKDVPMGSVIVAVRNISENSVITRDMVQEKQMPLMYVLPEAFTELQEVVGVTASAAILKGEQVVKTRLLKEVNKAAFSYRIPSGKRAVSIKTDPDSGTSWLIQPKDKVDVVATLTIPADARYREEAIAADGGTYNGYMNFSRWEPELDFFQKVARKLFEGKRIISFDGKNITFTMFQNIEVLAVGNRINSSESIVSTQGLGIEEGGRNVRTVTLCLDSEQVELISNMEKVGIIKFDLRNPTDAQIVNHKPIIEYKPLVE